MMHFLQRYYFLLLAGLVHLQYLTNLILMAVQEHNVDVAKRYVKLQTSTVCPDPGIAMVPPSVVLHYWKTSNGHVKEDLRQYTYKLPQEILSGVAGKADLLAPLHLSTTNLARTVSSNVKDTQLSFSRIESEVAPLLFQAFSTIPYISQVSYIGRDGLLFSYYNEENQQPIAVYTNTSSLISVNEELPAAANQNLITCYSQPANRDTGILYGDVTVHPPSTLLDPSILREVVDSTTGIASVAPSWIDNKDLLFLNTAPVDGRGAISVGFEAKAIVQSLSGSSISNHGSLFLSTKDGQVLSTAKIPDTQIVINVGNNSVALKALNRNGDQVGDIAGNLTCQANDGTLQPTTITISETKYDVYCSQVEIIGTELIFVSAMPIEEPERSLHKHFEESYRYLVGTICVIYAIIAIFAGLTVGALKTVAWYHIALQKQEAATAQAERIGIKKSTNYANASHDVRASLAGIIGLIDMCLTRVEPGSDLEADIKLMNKNSQYLLGILNNILDRSKLEAGKATLDQEDFEVSQLLEDVADLFHAVGMKKDVDVLLDLCDGSVNRFDHVRGDRKKLGQILSNVISNAVKFTSEGYVTIRAYARKPSSSSAVSDSTKKGLLSRLSSFLSPKKEACSEYETNTDNLRKDECMEFVFEVDDTGAGIPKDKQETVFENYAQIKDPSAAQVGTGLGLGIVQSLVRLMGGDIEIVDKEIGKKGTCFKFNIFLSMRENERGSDARRDHGESLSVQNMRFISSPHREASQVILFIRNEERRNICKTFMERQGVNKVLVVRNSEELSSSLKRVIRHRRVLSQNSSSSKNSKGSHSSLDGIDMEVLPTHRRRGTRGSLLPPFVLMVIDTSAGHFGEVCGIVAELRRTISTGYSRVVWLDRPGYIKLQQGLADQLPANDVIIRQPFHGSRLEQVLKLLPEFGGETSEVDPPAASRSPPRPIASSSPSSTLISLPLDTTEIKEVEKPLSGKKVLVVDDEFLLRRIAEAVLSSIGATNIETSTNGQEALQTVAKALEDQKASGTPHSLPYHYIFMDCQMPVMDGIEATRRIREEEAKYGLHIPIFAVSAHTDGPEIEQMKEAGVDYNLSKPLNAAKLVEFFRSFEV